MTVNPLASFSFDKSELSNDEILESPERLAYSTSFWQKIIHFPERRRLDEHIKQQVVDLFQKRYHVDNKKIFNRIWDKIGVNVWNLDSPLTAGKLKEIDQAFASQLIFHGQGIQAPSKRTENDKTVQQVVRSLLHGGPISSDIFGMQTLKAVFVTENSAMMEDFRKELQYELNNLTLNLPKNAQEEIIWRAFLGNIIALLPFAYPKNGEVFTIPVLQENICTAVEYTCEILPLELSIFSSPMSALGLTSKVKDQTPPILAFLGTTYPSGEGFAATVLSDFTPAHSVGEAIYNKNKELIANWFKDKSDVHLIGTSLGGALSFQTYIDHFDKLSTVDVYNPPGLYSKQWKGEEAKKDSNNCKVNIYCQDGDLVSKMGAWPIGKNISLYSIMPHHQGVEENIISSHTRAFTGCRRVTVIKLNPEKENNSLSRKFLTMVHKFLGPWVIFLPVGCAMVFYYFLSSIYRISALCIRKIKKIGQLHT